MKYLTVDSYKATEKQEALEDLVVKITTNRFGGRLDGLFIPALHDDECEELTRKFSEAFQCLDNLYEKSIKRTHWADTEAYAVYIED